MELNLNVFLLFKLTLRLLYLHDQMKLTIVQIADNDHRNNFVKFHCSIFEYLNNKVGFAAHWNQW